MLRIMLLSLVLFTIVAASMGQTFQYSRGWTNGKRASTVAGVSLIGNHLHRNDNSLPELFELQDGDHKLERCLLQLQRFVRNPLLLHSASYYGGLPLPLSAANNNNNNNYGAHHSSNELYEDGVNSSVEPNDYTKH